MIPRMFLLWLALSCVIAGCDRDEKGEQARAAEEKWERLRSDYGPVPSADEGSVLDRPYPTVVLTPDETLIRGDEVGSPPTVMEFARRLGDQTDASETPTWVVWAVREVTVERLARSVETLRAAAENPRVFLAVEVASGKSSAVRGVQLAPADDPELSASNAFAVHAPAQTPVTDFLDQFQRRRGTRKRGLEQLSE